MILKADRKQVNKNGGTSGGMSGTWESVVESGPSDLSVKERTGGAGAAREQWGHVVG